MFPVIPSRPVALSELFSSVFGKRPAPEPDATPTGGHKRANGDTTERGNGGDSAGGNGGENGGAMGVSGGVKQRGAKRRCADGHAAVAVGGEEEEGDIEVGSLFM